MSAMIPLALEVLTELVPIVETLIQKLSSGTPVTEDDLNAAQAAVDKANLAIQAA